MDLLKRNLAPIPAEAWEEIDDRAVEVIKSQLSARKALFVDGPHGPEKTVVPTGRLEVFKDAPEGEVGAGTYGAKPLIESRVVFKLSRWELDNILHGERDVELDKLEDAAEAIARFEDDVVLNGRKEAGVQGLTQVAGTTLKLDANADTIVRTIGEGLATLRDAYAEGPYKLIVGDDVYGALHQGYHSGILRRVVEEMTGAPIVRARPLKGAVLVPEDHEDLELTIGQDYAVGYESHDETHVQLFLTNAFTFRCLDEDIVVHFQYTGG